jgi:hypothetical protein
MKRLHLVDGTFELFRAYYAVPSSRAPDGREVGAIRGVIGSTLAWLRDGTVTHVAVATDHVIESFRNTLFDGYKTGDGIPPDLWAQFPLVEEAFAALGVCVWPMIEFEADDAIATAAARFASLVDQVVIASPDKDFAQCVDGEHVVLHDRIRRVVYDEEAVRTKFRAPPARSPTFLAGRRQRRRPCPAFLVGAASLRQPCFRVRQHRRHPRQSCILDRTCPQSWHLAAALTVQRADAQLYKHPATLRRDVPLRESLPISPGAEYRGANMAVSARGSD